MKGHWLSGLVCFNDLFFSDSNYLSSNKILALYLFDNSCTFIYMFYLALRFVHRPHWKSNLLCMSRRVISENVEVKKTDRYTEPSCIKMLPDVGMVKMYPKCVLSIAKPTWNTIAHWIAILLLLCKHCTALEFALSRCDFLLRTILYNC